MEKGVYVKDIAANTQVAGLFAVDNAVQAVARNGQRYWRLVLCDASGKIEAKIWHPLSSRFSEIENGSIVFAAGGAAMYQNDLQMAISRFEPLEPEELENIDLKDFTPQSGRSAEDMFRELYSLCGREFRHQGWRALVFSVLNNAWLCGELKRCPAAKNLHHAYAGGLLEHSLSVFKLCGHFANHYRELDRQTLLAGAIFHDIGKIREFSRGVSPDYTDEGQLLGHMILGLEILAPFLAESGLEPPLQEHLKHLILSHHGHMEFGAVKLPQTAEAFALHYADDMDAKLAQCRGLFSNGDAASPRWSDWQRSLERRMFMPVRTPPSFEAGQGMLFQE